jgi:hypothetical protein
VRLNEIFETYKDDVEILLIYIREAHAADGWVTPQNLYDGIDYNEPTTDDERANVAHVCQIELGLNMPMFLDGIDNDVEEKYITAPMRLYLVDKDGTIVFNGAQGPFGWDADAWEDAIKEQLAG